MNSTCVLTAEELGLVVVVVAVIVAVDECGAFFNMSFLISSHFVLEVKEESRLRVGLVVRLMQESL